jgi:hypothetical protein
VVRRPPHPLTSSSSSSSFHHNACRVRAVVRVVCRACACGGAQHR